MFSCFNPNKVIIYDIYIGFNTRQRVKYYYDNVHFKSKSLGDNYWIKWSKQNNHHYIKPGKKGRIEYDPLYHNGSI